MTDYYFYPYIALTGGADGALDSLDGSLLKDGDAALVVIPATQTVYTYTLDADSGAAESSPDVISPDSNAGDKRWILTNTGTNVNSSSVDFLQSGTGAVTRTAQAKMRDVVSVKDFGAVGDGITDDTDAIQAAIDSVGTAGTVIIPDGNYLVTSTILISNPEVHLWGMGQWTTKITFAPTAADTCLEIHDGANVIYNGSVKGIAFYSADTTYAKIAIDVIDVKVYYFEDIYIAGAGTNSLWSGGSRSYGIVVRGRDTTVLDRLEILADVPILITTNPNNDIDIDHFIFNNCYLLSKTTEPVVWINDGVNLTQVKFTGYQSWIYGKYGLYWSDSSTSAVSNGLTIENVRHEQETETTGYMFLISHNYGLQRAVFKNCYGGLNAGGYYFRKVQNISIEDGYYIGGSSHEAMNVDGTVDGITIGNSFWQSSGTATLTGQRLVSKTPMNPTDAPLPQNGVYALSTGAASHAFFGNMETWTSGSVADDGTTQVCADNFAGLLIVVDSQGLTGMYTINADNNDVTLVDAGYGSNYTVTVDTDEKTNIYYSTHYTLQNKRGVARTYTITTIGFLK